MENLWFGHYSDLERWDLIFDLIPELRGFPPSPNQNMETLKYRFLRENEWYVLELKYRNKTS
jgi:hypothetical protein